MPPRDRRHIRTWNAGFGNDLALLSKAPLPARLSDNIKPLIKIISRHITKTTFSRSNPIQKTGLTWLSQGGIRRMGTIKRMASAIIQLRIGNIFHMSRNQYMVQWLRLM